MKKLLIVVSASAILASSVAYAASTSKLVEQAVPASATPVYQAFTLPKLPYAYNALEPVIDAKTMEIHYTKHHAAYVKNLNDEVSKNPELKNYNLEAILENVAKFNDTVRNNAGGHWNHTFFWQIMAPKGSGGVVSAQLKTDIINQFGSMEDFMAAFEKAGTSRFGSGWVWLIVDKDKKLKIISTPNQNNPLMGDAPEKGLPILANDLWEHAYYLQYQNKRGDYLKAWWDVVNWNKVNELYASALASR